MTEETLLHEALKRGPAERGAYLDAACGDDAALRARLDSLLAAADQAGDFLRTGEGAPTATHPGAEGPSLSPDTPTLAFGGGPAPAGEFAFLLPPRDPKRVGRLGHYEILEVVGRGGMGVVFRAFDEKLHRIVALKTLAPALAADGAARRRFLREARAAAAVAHEHVIATHAVEEEGRVPYLVMQFIDGQTLDAKLRKEGPPPLKEILRIGSQAAAGLAAAHRLGLVHRDIKPGNILLENGIEKVKLTDFGLARAVDDGGLTQTGAIAGTPQFMSPEQAEGQAVDQRSDLFSLGSVLYALAGGRPPFRAETPLAVLRRVCDDTPRPLRELNPDVPDWLAAIVAKLMAKRPADRFQTADEVADLLRRHLAHEQEPQATPMPAPVGTLAPPNVGRARRFAQWLALAAAILLLFALLERRGFTNFTSKLLWFFRHELTLELPDRETIVELWATDEEVERPNAYSIKSGWPFEATAQIADEETKKLRLAPGNYWLFAKRRGQTVQRKIVKIPWGGSSMLTVNDEKAAAADLKQLQGEWEAVSVRYLDGPHLGPEALPLTEFEVQGSRLRLRLPGLDTGADFRPLAFGGRRSLQLNSAAAGPAFAVERVLDYELTDGLLRLKAKAPQPLAPDESRHRWGIPESVGRQSGFEIVLRRKGAAEPLKPPADLLTPPKLTEFEAKLLAAINRERAKAKAPPLAAEARLTRAARGHADDMARWGKLEHVLEGKDLPSRLGEAGYAAAGFGENIGFNQRDPEEAMDGWLRSAGHRANVLNPKLTQIGLGTGRDDKGQAWHAVIFAAPAAGR